MNVTRKITVTAPARLHMGFIDLSGSLGRRFGSIGAGLKELSTQIIIQQSESLEVTGISGSRAKQCVAQLCDRLDISSKVKVQVVQAIPEHVGLGSGTQMALAIGMGLSELYQLDMKVREVAYIADRGRRSGIGIGVFEKGGLIVDGGRGPTTKTPPLIAQLEIPEAWRFILVFEQTNQGLYGDQERAAFDRLATFSKDEAARICYLILMQALPSLAEHDLEKFGHVITQVQELIGRYFSRAQGGVFTSSKVHQVMEWLAVQGAVGIGQTSWGPTGFCLVENKQQADALIVRARNQFESVDGLTFMIASANNTGGEIETISC